MAKYFRHSLLSQGGFGVSPPVAPLNGLQPFRRSRVEAVIRGQDTVVATGRRIVATAGLRGSETFFVPDTDPSLVGGSHPDPGEARLIAASSVDLTPGCFLRCWAVVVPSGETQAAGPIAGGRSGELRIDVTWTDQDGGSVSTSHTIILEGSVEDFGAQPAVQWDAHYVYDTGVLAPANINQTDQVRRWSRAANIRVLVYAIGGARPVDVCVFEEPVTVAMEADDDGEEWCSGIYAPGEPGGPAGPLLYPWQRLSETSPDGDPRGGTLSLMDVHHAQHQRLGPVLFSWSGAEESSGETGFSTSSTTLVELAGGGSTSWTLTEPGLMVGTGGYARRYSSNSEFVLRDRVAAIPVFVRAYASAAGDGPGTIQVWTREDSYIDLSVPTGAAAWHRAYGWLEVGINPDDTASLVAQLFGLTGGGLAPDLTVHSVTVHYAGGYTPAA